MKSLNETAYLSKFIAVLLGGAMLSYTFINSHSQVSDPGPEGLVPILIQGKL